MLILLLSSVAYAGETQYKDMPTSSIDNVFIQVLEQYSEQSKSRLAHFNQQFQSKEGRTFYVVSKIYQGDIFEQVFILLNDITDDSYLGTIANNPMGKVDFKAGDAIEVKTKDVVDWVIVNTDGSEEGNLQGKALDLIQVGHGAFISKMTPKDGVLSEFEVISVLNPYTKQEIIDIVPQSVLDNVANKVKLIHGKKPSAGDKEQYTYTIVRFPGWEIIDSANNK